MRKWSKKSGLMMLVLLILSFMLSTMAVAYDGITVLVNGEPVAFDVQPQLIHGRTMVPLRAIFEELGVKVDWDKNTRTVTATRDDRVVISTIGSKTMHINDEEKIMDVAPTIVKGRTLVPVRFVAEAFDCYVEWDGGSRTVYVESDYTMDDEEDSETLPDGHEQLTEEEIYDMFE